MLSTINFDYQFLIETNEIDNVWAKGLLTLELPSLETMRSQLPPYGGLGIRGIAAHVFCKFEQASCHSHTVY